VGRWDQKGSEGDWLGVCGLDSTGSGRGPVVGCCECDDEPLGSCAIELVNMRFLCLLVSFPLLMCRIQLNANVFHPCFL
jgi:hypothetical protein